MQNKTNPTFAATAAVVLLALLPAAGGLAQVAVSTAETTVGGKACALLDVRIAGLAPSEIERCFVPIRLSLEGEADPDYGSLGFFLYPLGANEEAGDILSIPRPGDRYRAGDEMSYVLDVARALRADEGGSRARLVLGDYSTGATGYGLHLVATRGGSSPAQVIKRTHRGIGASHQSRRAAWHVTPGADAGAVVLSAYPNPFNPTVTIRLAGVPDGCRDGKLSLFDLRGRRIREWHVEGDATVRWSPARDGERSAASGVYFCVYSCPGAGVLVKQRLLLLK